MAKLLLALIVIWACAPAGAGAPGSTAPGSAAPGSRGASGESGADGDREGAGPQDPAVARFVELVNARRTADGCPALAWDPAVAAIASAHSRDMLERGYFSHVSPDGSDPFDRLRAAGVAFVAAAENVAYGDTTGDGVFRQWQGSAGHRANMLSCTYTRHGVGRAGTYWTQLLIRPPG